MEPRLPYMHLAPDGFAQMRALEHSINTASGLEPVLLGLVRLRASLLNGCEYCIHMHTGELRKHHEPQTRIDSLTEWRNSDAYTQRERAALGWTEAVTDIQDGHAPDPVYDELRAHFTEVEAVNLTLAITSINAWNRIAIALGAYPGHAGGAKPQGSPD
jgi:AhpD family alkylhydroperoxidase